MAKARELLAAAGFPNGSGLPEFEILYRADFAYRKFEAEVLVSQLSAVGIRARAIGLPTRSAFFSRISRGPGGSPGSYRMAIFAWAAEPNDDFMKEMFLQGALQNVYGYRNPEVTLLIAEALREADRAKRVELLRRAEQLVLTDAPVVPLFYLRVP